MLSRSLRGREVFVTSDEHYGHHNIIRFCDRPFTSVEEMNESLIQNFNSVTTKKSITIHAGDFYLGSLSTEEVMKSIANRLNGSHIFLMGNHERWLNNVPKIPDIMDVKMGEEYMVVCHYCMRVWNRSHYNSWHLFGHSHGKLEPIGKSWDVGVDNNNFFPLSFDQIRTIMNSRPDNPNLIKGK